MVYIKKQFGIVFGMRLHADGLRIVRMENVDGRL